MIYRIREIHYDIGWRHRFFRGRMISFPLFPKSKQFISHPEKYISQKQKNMAYRIMEIHYNIGWRTPLLPRPHDFFPSLLAKQFISDPEKYISQEERNIVYRIMEIHYMKLDGGHRFSQGRMISFPLFQKSKFWPRYLSPKIWVLKFKYHNRKFGTIKRPHEIYIAL